MTRFDTVRVAAIQATPVILDAEASVDKAIRLLGEAADQGVQLAVLPETFVPLYPSNSWARQAASFAGFDELWERLWENSVDVPGPLVDRLSEACRSVPTPRCATEDSISLRSSHRRTGGRCCVHEPPEAIPRRSAPRRRARCAIKGRTRSLAR